MTHSGRTQQNGGAGYSLRRLGLSKSASFLTVSYYFLIKILILIREASPEGAAGFVIYKERNHKTSLI